jgi:DNA-binding NarL/FixJ family response regulator
MKKAPINIILADDNEIFRLGFITLLSKQPGIKLVAQASNGQDLVVLAKKLQPAVIITDIKMPVMDGIEATKYLSEHLPHIAVIAMTMYDDEDIVSDMIRAGAKGHLLKNAQKEEIIEAISSAHNNRRYYCKETMPILEKLQENKMIDRSHSIRNFNLTEKEKLIITLICREFSNKEIGKMLGLSPRTIEGYRETIMEKLQVRKSAGIIRFALAHRKLFPDL